jgi:hypothetical protein
LIGAIEEPYIRHLKDPNTAYNTIALETMLAYLFAEYGDIDDNALAENEKRLVEPWDGVKQLENVFTRIHECIDFAEAAEQPCTDKQILSKALAIVFHTGLYADDIKEWTKFGANLKNLATFKTHFLKAQKTLCKQRATTKQMGYGLVAVQIHEILEQFANFVSSEQAEKAADRATKTVEQDATRAALQVLATQNAYLTRQLNVVSRQLAKTVSRMGTPRSAFTNTPGPNQRQQRIPTDQGRYCWSHRCLVTPRHTSMTCMAKLPGHKDNATRSNMMGGSIVGKPAA